MRKNVYTKEREKKLKETIRELRAENRSLRKENKLLKEELKNIIKPVRPRKKRVDQKKLTHDEWRKDFVERFKKNISEKKGIELWDTKK